MFKFEKRSQVSVPASFAFDWHQRNGALERLLPPWQELQLLHSEGIEDGCRVKLRIRKGPISIPWVSEHFNFLQGSHFSDRQVEGPFSHFEHHHEFRTLTPDSFEMNDRIHYLPPAGKLGTWFLSSYIEKDLQKTFDYRHRVLERDLPFHWAHSKRSMKFVVSGSSGLIGSQLIPFLQTGGHQVIRLVRGTSTNPGEVTWDPYSPLQDEALEKLEGVDAFLHLSGENVASGRWNAERKEQIRKSRIESTTTLATSFEKLKRKPKLFLSASAIGIYGNRGEELLTEDSTLPSDDFLASVVRDWEAAASRARESGIRTLFLRFGVVLSPKGGALKKMLPAFRLGLGSAFGTGKQWMSWISLDDVLRAILFLAQHDSAEGPFNLSSPLPLTNQEFTRILATHLHRSTLPQVPAAVLRTAFGEMADSIFLSSSRVLPSKLEQLGFSFVDPRLDSALRHLLPYD